MLDAILSGVALLLQSCLSPPVCMYICTPNVGIESWDKARGCTLPTRGDAKRSLREARQGKARQGHLRLVNFVPARSQGPTSSCVTKEVAKI